MVVKFDLLGLDAVLFFEHGVNDVHQLILFSAVADHHRRQFLVLLKKVEDRCLNGGAHLSALGNVSGVVLDLFTDNLTRPHLVGNRRGACLARRTTA